MARNKVMKLWTAIVTAFLALCTALGLVTATSTTAVAQSETPRNRIAYPTLPTMSHWSWPPSWSHAMALPPTMKQRIGAEAHGKSPSCRHRPDAEATEADVPAEVTAPLTC
ncbi:DUF6344 domain-containing protein [Streptomyces olivochromogenes]|uniref:DUF6344 domain-containing protein n=1 Tax=Streptomyces olivochromogenes TaxID=1963 RepID=UPI001F2E90DE|nr:DUF6344 domain-containing protein [Streptomyces olivochromogenes]MCF3129071.1 hypothetical protein [Streptomyces olivochromogenes]